MALFKPSQHAEDLETLQNQYAETKARADDLSAAIEAQQADALLGRGDEQALFAMAGEYQQQLSRLAMIERSMEVVRERERQAQIEAERAKRQSELKAVRARLGRLYSLCRALTFDIGKLWEDWRKLTTEAEQCRKLIRGDSPMANFIRLRLSGEHLRSFVEAELGRIGGRSTYDPDYNLRIPGAEAQRLPGWRAQHPDLEGAVRGLFENRINIYSETRTAEAVTIAEQPPKPQQPIAGEEITPVIDERTKGPGPISAQIKREFLDGTQDGLDSPHAKASRFVVAQSAETADWEARRRIQVTSKEEAEFLQRSHALFYGPSQYPEAKVESPFGPLPPSSPEARNAEFGAIVGPPDFVKSQTARSKALDRKAAKEAAELAAREKGAALFEKMQEKFAEPALADPARVASMNAARASKIRELTPSEEQSIREAEAAAREGAEDDGATE
jgi:hypothetical protein